MKWLITGGCGFLGRNLVAALLAQGQQRIRVLDNLSVGSEADLAQVATVRRAFPGGRSSALGAREVELWQADILQADILRRAAEGVDVLVHLAANTGVGPSVEDPRGDCVTNVLGVLNALEAARQEGVTRFIFASSGAPLGACEPPIHEELAPHPASPYGASKLAGEGYCSAYHHCFGVAAVALRFGNVYGPRSGHKQSVVARFLQRAMQGLPLEVCGDGGQTRDFIYVDDLIRAIRLAAEVPGVGGETFQIATNRETTVRELAEAVQRVFEEAGRTPPQVTYVDPRVGDAQRNYSDISKARRRLGWEPRTELEEGLRLTWRWFQQHAAASATGRAA